MRMNLAKCLTSVEFAQQIETDVDGLVWLSFKHNFYRPSGCLHLIIQVSNNLSSTTAQHVNASRLDYNLLIRIIV